jgi:hypothetical protein
MPQKPVDKMSTSLRRLAAVEGDIIVNRPPREPITGLAFETQHCSLILDWPDDTGNESYPCKITDVSEGGFGVMCGAAKKIPHPFKFGTQMTLHDPEGKRVRVEIRWVNYGRLGVRRLGAGAR